MQVLLLQSSLWGQFKSAFGWNSFVLSLSTGPLRIFVRPLPFGFSLVYIPYGFESIAQLSAVKEECIRLVREQVPKALFIRFDLADSVAFPSPEGIDPAFSFSVPPWLKPTAAVQPPDTVVLSLEGTTPEALLAAMHKKTRYNIKLAEKKGVITQSAGLDRLADWYRLYEITARRDRISIHSFAYYQKLFLLAQNDPQVTVRLLLAFHESDLLAGIIVVYCQRQALYLYGAASNEKRSLMPAYALQWRAIREAMEAGCTSYDFYGIPPTPDPNHPMAGLYRFKTGFGGSIVHRAGAWDLPLKPFAYRLFRWAERGRLFYYRRLRKRKK